MIEQDIRKPGRPKNQAISESPVKKGKTSWKPASVTDVVDKDPSKRYRLVNKDADNLAKKRAEGWEIETKATGGSAKLVPDGQINTGSNLGSTYERKDVILMSMPEEMAQERNKYFDEMTQRRTQGLTAHLKKELKGTAPTHGKITIGSLKQGETVIE
jgi:hypothetical protein